MSRRVLALLALPVLTGAGLLTATPASAAPEDPCATSSRDYFLLNDIDNDTAADLPVGNPRATVDGKAGAGAVDVRYSVDGTRPAAAHGPQRITAATLGRSVAAGDGFGTSLAMGGFKTYCADIAIGVPGADGGAGAVLVAIGSGDGIVPGRTVVLHAPSRHAGDAFGATVAKKSGELWVGAPNRTVNGRAGAGAIEVFTYRGETFTHDRTITEATQGVPGEPETDDHFGSRLSVKEYAVYVGEPDEDVGKIKDAGTVTRFETGRPPATVSQDSPGVPGTAEAGDRFGASVSAGTHSIIAVGVPGEDVGTIRDAGLVQAFHWYERAWARGSVTLDSAGVSGTAQPGDRFGTSVQFGRFTDTPVSVYNVAVGVPGADVGDDADAGSVSILSFQEDGADARYADAEVPLTQGAGLGGVPKAGDGVGTSLSAVVLPYRSGSGYSRGELLVAAPGDDVGAADAGTMTLRTSPEAGRYAPVVYQDLGGAAAAGRYGVGPTQEAPGFTPI